MDIIKIVDTFLKEYFGRKISYEQIGDLSLERNYIFDLVDTPYILKFFGDKHKWEREISSLKFLSEKNLSVPHIYDCGVYNDEFFWAIITRLPGINFQTALHNLSDKDIRNIIFESGEFLGTFHQLTRTNKFGRLDTNQSISITNSSFFEFETEKNRRRANRTLNLKGKDTTLFEKAIKEMVFLENSLQDIHSFSLCHNDFCPRNILIQQQKGKWNISGVIDFETSYISDPDSDITKMLFNFFDTPKEKVFLEGYCSVYPQWKLNENKQRYYLISLCLEICSWSLERSNDYFLKAEKLLRTILANSNFHE